MKQNLKFLFVGFICSTLIFSIIILMLYDTIPATGPDTTTEPEELDYMDLEIGKFPGEKYTTYYHIDGDSSTPSDSYDPLKNSYYANNYLLKYANTYITTDENVYEIKFNNTIYKGNIFSGVALNETAPYMSIAVPEYMVKGEDKFYAAEVWLHSGEIKALYYDEAHDIGNPLSEDELKQIVNAKASEYIDISKYEIEFDFENCRATYHQKFGDLYLANPFNIKFGKDGFIYWIDFNKTGIYDELEYDLEEVRRSIEERLDDLGLSGKSYKIKNIDICKYDVPVVVSTIQLYNCTFTFFTKIID